MYKSHEEHSVSLVREWRDQPRLYTTHFEGKIKPGPNTVLIYYCSASSHI
jgi:hypothetical protein